jgi:hypothetical protein
MLSRRLPLLLLVDLLSTWSNILLVEGFNPGTVTIRLEAGYSSLRPCAQNCFCCDASQALLYKGLGCGDPALDNYFCRTDLYSFATTFLNKCVTSVCTAGNNPGPDATSAIAFYSSYCSANGYIGITQAPSTPTVTKVTIVTQTITSNSGTATQGKWFDLVPGMVAAIFCLAIV